MWDTKTRALITYRYIPGEMNPLASNHIHCLFVDSSGYLWIGTNAGLDQYDKRTGRFDHFTVQDGLSGNIVRGIREGEPGILFVSTNKGLSRLIYKTGISLIIRRQTVYYRMSLWVALAVSANRVNLYLAVMRGSFLLIPFS